jgi:hypothetical protein
MTWFYPSYGRAQKCANVLTMMRRQGAEADGFVYVSEDDPEIEDYRALSLPKGWALMVMPAGQGWLADKLNHAFETHPDLPWYGVVYDDLVFTTDFEGQLVGAAGRFKIASAAFGANRMDPGTRIQGAAVFGGDLLRALGYWVPAGIRHLFTDDAWELLGKTLRVWRILPEVVTVHDHPVTTNAAWDATYARGNSEERFLEDKKAFEDWCNKFATADILRANEVLDAARRKVIERARQRSLMISVTTYDRPTPETMGSLAETTALLTKFGIRFRLATSKGMSLLPIARNYTANSFLKSDCDDILLIDDDMQWDAWDVVKLMASPQEVIAGIGKRKDLRSDSDINAWCFCLRDDFEPKDDLTVDDYGAIKVARVGTAFLRIRRSALEKIAANTPELKRRCVTLRGDTAEWYHKFFAITDISEIEAGEDFSFCNLWHDAGGSVWIDPSIRLVHWGRYGYSGEVSSLFHLDADEYARQTI